MMPFGSECCKGSKLHVDLFLESYTRRTTHNGILKNWTVANFKKAWSMYCSCKGCNIRNFKKLLISLSEGVTMYNDAMVKGSKLHVDLFLESYTRRTTHMEF